MGDPASIALMAGMMGSSLIGGITAPQGQQLTSFEGIPGADPAEMFGETKGLLSDYLNAMITQAGQPVKLNTTVAPLPIFKGGALPTSIGATALDPNRYSPSLRETPGTPIAKRTLSEVDPSATRRRTPNYQDGTSPGGTTDPGGVDHPDDGRTPYTPPPPSGRTAMPPPRPTPTVAPRTLGGDLVENPENPRRVVPDDQASAAAELLASLTGGGSGDINGMLDIPNVDQLAKRRLMA